MIKIYSMSNSKDCINLKEQLENSIKYAVIYIGLDVKNLKYFLKLRNHHVTLEQARKTGTIGVPCFILEDGTVTLVPEEAELSSTPIANLPSCSI